MTLTLTLILALILTLTLTLTQAAEQRAAECAVADRVAEYEAAAEAAEQLVEEAVATMGAAAAEAAAAEVEAEVRAEEELVRLVEEERVRKEAEDKAAAEAARAAAKEEARKAAAARAVVEKQAKLDRILLEDSLRAKLRIFFDELRNVPSSEASPWKRALALQEMTSKVRRQQQTPYPTALHRAQPHPQNQLLLRIAKVNFDHRSGHLAGFHQLLRHKL